MERAQAHEVGAAFFQLHVAADDLDHVGAGNQFLDKCMGDGHVTIVALNGGIPKLQRKRFLLSPLQRPQQRLNRAGATLILEKMGVSLRVK